MLLPEDMGTACMWQQAASSLALVASCMASFAVQTFFLLAKRKKEQEELERGYSSLSSDDSDGAGLEDAFQRRTIPIVSMSPMRQRAMP